MKVTPLLSIRQELDSAGIRYEIRERGKHFKVRFYIRGRKCSIICSKSASDRRAALNARLRARRTIRQALEKVD